MAKLIFSMKLNTKTDLSTIKTSFISGDNLTIIESTQEQPKLNLENRRELMIKIVPDIKQLNQGSIKVVFEDPSKIKSAKSPLIFLKKNETIINPVSYYKASSEAAVTRILRRVDLIVKGVIIAAFMVSVSTALALIKVKQMLGFLLFLNISHPSNVKSFLQIFSDSVFEDLPNSLSFLTDDSCNITQERFLEEGVSCQIFENLGNYIVLVVLFLIAKIFYLVVSRLTHKKFEKVSCFFKARSDRMGLKFWLEVMESIQLNVFMTFFLWVMNYESEQTRIAETNFFIGGLASFVAVVVNFSLIFF